MKRIILLFGIFLLFVSPILAQTLQDYVLETRGDTLVVKDDNDYGAPNTLYSLMNADSSAPADRVYLLHNGGIYSLVNNPTSSATHKTIIMGETQTSLKVSGTATAPPILQGSTFQGGNTTGGINSGGDLLVKNVDVEIGNSAGSEGWAFFGFSGPSERIQVDNCIIEHNLWTVIGGPPANESMFFTNDYFVNLDGYTCRRNGGVIDYFSNQDTIFVENCTHVNTQGSLYKTRPAYAINKVLFNHNDFIDCSGFVFMNSGGDQANYSVTNNIFVNCQLQAYAPVLSNSDVGEVDVDSLPMGLVNLKADSLFLANGASFYADRNLVYWDPSLSDIVTTLNTNKVNGSTNWVSQMITMNKRTADLFNDKTNYPRLTNGTWIENQLPSFKKTDVLFTTQLATLKAYSISAVDTSFTGSLKSWRQPSNPESQYYTYADWPIPIDLSYTDNNLLTAGLNGFPVGDLDWFPTQYAAWKAQESTELAQIANVLKNGITGIEKTTVVPKQFQMQQNYPNPFNPTTVINFTIPKSGNVTLKVYNLLGQEVATLVDGYRTAQTYNINFNASNLASGVYIYTIRYGDQTISKKMVLMK